MRPPTSVGREDHSRRRHMSTEPVPKVHRGLKDVYFERSAVTLIDGKAGELRYRGYSIHDLPRNSTFEETAYLLLHSELPIAGPWHGDALKLGMDGKRTIELTRNVWLAEIAELAGQKKSETEQVKHQISRASDADRLVWDSYTT